MCLNLRHYIADRQFSVDLALYAVLFHILGGMDAKLTAPPTKANKSVDSFGVYAREKRRDYKDRLNDLTTEVRRAPEHLLAQRTAALDAHHELGRGTALLDELIVRLRGEPRLALAAPAPGAPEPGGRVRGRGPSRA